MSYHGNSSGGSTNGGAVAPASGASSPAQGVGIYTIEQSAALLAGLPTPPAGMHYMEDGSLMSGETHVDITNPVPNYQATLPVNSGQSDAFRSSRTSAPVYADIPLDLKIHPNLYDVRPLKDTRAVQQSVKNLVLSNFADRPFQPELGSNVTALLFEPADVGTAIAIREEIVRVLTDHEPRVANITVEVFDNSDRNAYQINIGYTVVISDTREETNFYLERLR